MIIIVTGCPGTGKTTIAKKIARQKKLKYIDVNQLIKDNKLYFYYNKKENAYVVDVKKLKKRLKKRKYSKEKIRTNLDCEIFDVCHIEALENKHNVKVIKTSR